MSSTLVPVTIEWKRVNGLQFHLDVYYPQAQDSDTSCPALVYFHAGGLTVGNRQSWFPEWLAKSVIQEGFLFISADYRLMPPSTGYDVLEDIKDLFHFLSQDINKHLPTQHQLDTSRISVAGSSAGGLCAYLAASHATPKPRCVVAFYAMGGDVTTWQYLAVKTNPFFRGRELLSPSDFPSFRYPESLLLPPITDSPQVYNSADSEKPGYPANPRMLLARLYLQEGNVLDYYTGQHEPSFSGLLRPLLDSPVAQVEIEKRLRDHAAIFPQLSDLTTFPPTLLAHGTKDTAVRIQDSRNMHRLLTAAGRVVHLYEVEGVGHSFDYQPGSEQEHGRLFADVISFILQHTITA